MQYREAAVRVSQTIMLISREMSASLGQIFQYQKEGKISPVESAAYYDIAHEVINKLLNCVIDPIYEAHPDLRPQCCACNAQDDPDEEQPY